MDHCKRATRYMNLSTNHPVDSKWWLRAMGQLHSLDNDWVVTNNCVHVKFVILLVLLGYLIQLPAVKCGWLHIIDFEKCKLLYLLDDADNYYRYIISQVPKLSVKKFS